MNSILDMSAPATSNKIIIHGDCLEELKKLEDNSVDAVVTDPPYGLTACEELPEAWREEWREAA